MKPFFCPHESENECVQNTCAKCLQPPNKALQELAANLGYKSPAQVKQIQKAAEKKGFCEGQRKCIAEVSSQLKSSALQAAYSTDVSVSKFEKLRKAQYFNSPSITSLQKKRYALRPHECGKFDELCQLLKDWEPSNTFVASELAKTFDVTCTDSSHKIKLLAQDVNPTIPGLEIVPKRKSTRVKLKGSDLSLPVPPSKKRLVEIDRSLVESGVLNEGVPCVPVSLVRFACESAVCVCVCLRVRVLSQNDVPEAASSEANEQPEEVQTRDGYTLQGSVQSVDTEGFVDLADEEVRNDQHSTLQSSMCQALPCL